MIPAAAVRDVWIGWHEAAHAVVGVACGVPVVSVTIDGDCGDEGRCEYRKDVPVDGFAAMKALAAGVVADMERWPAQGGLFRAGGHDDVQSVREILRARGKDVPDQLERVLLATRGDVLRLWSAIVDVSEALLKRRTVDGEAVRRIVFPLVGADVPGSHLARGDQAERVRP